MEVFRPTLWSGRVHKTTSRMLEELGIEKTERACQMSILLQYTQHPRLAKKLVLHSSPASLSLRMRGVRKLLKKRGMKICQLLANSELSRMRYDAAVREEGRRRRR